MMLTSDLKIFWASLAFPLFAILIGGSLILAHRDNYEEGYGGYEERYGGYKEEISSEADYEPIEDPDPATVARWTVNTFQDAFADDIWRKYKSKFKIDDILLARNMFRWEKTIRSIWMSRVLMLKAKHRVLQFKDDPYPIDRSTMMPLVDQCDLDVFMCANRPKPYTRIKFETYLRKNHRKSLIYGGGNEGFNPYTLAKSVFILFTRFMALVRHLPGTNLTEELNVDEFLEKAGENFVLKPEAKKLSPPR